MLPACRPLGNGEAAAEKEDAEDPFARFTQRGNMRRLVSTLTLVSACVPHIEEESQALHNGPQNAALCGQPSSDCEILGGGFPNPRALSRIKNNGDFFVTSAGDPFNDLFAEAIVGTGTNIDSSSIYKWTNSGGLQPWIIQKPSQLLVVFDPVFGGPTPFQAGINGVEIQGNDLYYTVTYNAGTTNYVDRMRSYTVETGISFGELRKVSNGVQNPAGTDTLLADVAAQEIINGNPDGVVYETPDPFGHQVGEPLYGTNPYGLLPRNNKTFVVDVASNDIYKVKNNGEIELHAVFPTLNGGERVPINLLESPNNKLYVTLFYGPNAGSSEALGGVAEVKNNGTFEMVSFHRLPISATFGPDGKLYVLEYADQLAPNTGRVLRVNPQSYGNYFDGKPVSDGTVIINGLNYPVDLAFDPQGDLVVLESGSLNPFQSVARLLRFSL